MLAALRRLRAGRRPGGEPDLVAVHDAEGTFRVLFGGSARPMFIVDPVTLRFLAVNDAACARYGYPREEFLTMRVGDVRRDGEGPVRERLAAGFTDCRLSMRGQHVTRAGDVLDVDCTVHLVTYSGHPAALVLADDVTEQRQLEAELRHRADHDDLTGLLNRARLREAITSALAGPGAGAVAVLLLDLDGFKAVNDSRGHATGDALLVAVADRLTRCVGGDQVVARLGGDEFAVVLPALTGSADAIQVAERILAVLAAPVRVGEVDVPVRASIGIAITAPGGDADELLRNADVAMYAAKDAGRNCYRVFDPAMHHGVIRQLELEVDLRLALDSGEFVVHYQPIVDFSRQRVSGLEALVRWQHRERGLVPPLEFIPAAEATGLILPLGRLVLREACRALMHWQERYPSDPPLTVSVNVSAHQVQDPALVFDVADALRHSGLTPAQLVLEITESILLHDVDVAVRRMRELKQLGVQLALDDFGTGYSSLSYLHRFPFDILKIDKSFVDRVHHGGTESALARAVIRLGRTLHLKTTAEGVETAEQAALLDALRCDYGQGYYFARPLDADGVDELLARARVGLAWATPSPAADPSRALIA